MKRWQKYIIAGIIALLVFAVTGCGGVSHKSPEKVTEELIQAYVGDKEKNVRTAIIRRTIRKRVCSLKLLLGSNSSRHM